MLISKKTDVLETKLKKMLIFKEADVLETKLKKIPILVNENYCFGQ